jgi:hypothetical protein
LTWFIPEASQMNRFLYPNEELIKNSIQLARYWFASTLK